MKRKCRGIKRFCNQSICIILIFSLVIFLFSCAATYHPIDFDKTFQNFTNENEISVTSNSFILENNPRFMSKAIKNNLRVIGIQINNNSNKCWILNPNNLNIRTQNGEEIILLEAKFASKLTKLGENGYAFWGLLWMVINGIPIPIGILLGISQIHKAKKSNQMMINDYNEKVVKQTTLKPYSSINGLLFLNLEDKNYNSTLYLKLVEEETGVEKIIEYKLSL